MLAHPDDIPTPRLVLRLMEREVVDACLVGNLQRAEQLLGIGIPTELLDEPHRSKIRTGPAGCRSAIPALVRPSDHLAGRANGGRPYSFS
jgi:hypothetical protein